MSTDSYITLYDGRHVLGEDTAGEGFDGPIFCSVNSVQLLYVSEIRWRDGRTTAENVLRVVDDCVYYDGKYYGNLEVWSAESYKNAVWADQDIIERLCAYDPEVARLRAEDQIQADSRRQLADMAEALLATIGAGVDKLTVPVVTPGTGKRLLRLRPKGES